MIRIAKYSFLLVFITFIISCEKEPISISEGILFGTWGSDSHSLIFRNDSSFIRVTPVGIINHDYRYSYSKDSITIKYLGPDKVLVQPSIHYYKLDGRELTIDFSNGCYGFEPEKRIYLKFIED
jgi:hypothetical protein